MAPKVGLEPTTDRLTAGCSTTELLRNNNMVGLNGLEPSTSRLSGVRSNQLSYRPIIGAGEGNRTLIISLEGWGFTTKLHPHIWWLRTESNRRHLDLQSFALPTELLTHIYLCFKKMAVPTGIEPAISCVTGRHVNRYTTGPFGCGGRIWTCDLRVMSPTSYHCSTPRQYYWYFIFLTVHHF